MIQKTTVDKYAARLLMVSFFLPMKLQVLVTMVLCGYFVVSAFISRQGPPRAQYLKALLMGSPFLLLLLAIPFTPHEYLKQLSSLSQHRVSVLIMPFVFAIIAPKSGVLLVNELVYFVYACTITCVTANAGFMYHYLAAGSSIALGHVAYRTMIHHFCDIHPTYLGMYLCFSICILLFIPANITRAATVLKNVLLFSSLAFLLALSPKTPLVALVIIFIHYAIVNRATLYKYKVLFAGMLATLAAAWFFVPFFSQRVKETIQGLGAGSGNVDNSISVRKTIWNMDTSLLKDYWLKGLGPGRLYTVLQQRYLAYSATGKLEVEYYDTHSEYFFQWISFGLVGILLFAVVLFVQFRKAIVGKDYLYLYLLIILSATFFTETVLSQQRGVIFYAIFTALFFMKPHQTGLAEPAV
jgi:O-antigen ligase